MYSIKSVQLNKQGVRTLFLVSENGRDFWTDWTKKNNTKHIAIGFASLMTQIQERGTDWAIKTKKMKIIDGNLGIIEIKNFEGIWRILSYLQIENRGRLVMLKEFRGHQGSDAIPPDVLEQCKKLAEVARGLITEEQSNVCYL